MAEPIRAHYLGEFVNTGGDAEVITYITTVLGIPAGSPVAAGMFYKDTTNGVYRIYNGTAWVDLGGGVGPTDSYREPGLINWVEPDGITEGSTGFDAQDPLSLGVSRQLDIGNDEDVILRIDTDGIGNFNIAATEVAGGGGTQNGYEHRLWFDLQGDNIIFPLGGNNGMVATIIIDDLTTPPPHEKLDKITVPIFSGAPV